MRIVHLSAGGISLLLFLFCTVYSARAYSYVPDEAHPGQNREVELSHLELSGWDFIAGNMPHALATISSPRPIPRYRNGADLCAVALLGLCLAAFFANRMFNPAWGNLFILANYLFGFIALDNFKNAYFNFAASLHTEKYTSITIDSHPAVAVAVVSGALLLLAALNIVFLFSKKLRRKHLEKVH